MEKLYSKFRCITRCQALLLTLVLFPLLLFVVSLGFFVKHSIRIDRCETYVCTINGWGIDYDMCPRSNTTRGWYPWWNVTTEPPSNKTMIYGNCWSAPSLALSGLYHHVDRIHYNCHDCATLGVPLLNWYRPHIENASLSFAIASFFFGIEVLMFAIFGCLACCTWWIDRRDRRRKYTSHFFDDSDQTTTTMDDYESRVSSASTAV